MSNSESVSAAFFLWFDKTIEKIPARQIESVLNLAADGATIPFMARYRKEQTGNLDEVQIGKILEGKSTWDEIIKRQAFIADEINKQEKLTDDLKKKIFATFSLEILEDIYLPFKKKKQTKAQKAKEAGLEPLADWIWQLGHGVKPTDAALDLNTKAAEFLNSEKKINDTPTALAGAQDIVIEKLVETADLRARVRDELFKNAGVRSVKGDKFKPASKFENYIDFEESIASLSQDKNSHRYLAMRRGWMEEELTVTIGGSRNNPGFEDGLLALFDAEACPKPGTPGVKDFLTKASRMALKAYVMPSLSNEIHTHLKKIADDYAIRVFTENVRKVLLSPPLGPKHVVGVDPGIRTGCKTVIVDNTGKLVAHFVMHIQTEIQKKQNYEDLAKLFKNTKIDAIAVGNGTAGRETESYLREVVKKLSLNIPVISVNESGASIYSAGAVAREEFPELDVTVRGAISIARRLQDPLAELVKVDPKSIGVGQYQHDVSQPALKKALDQVVDSCVNSVGVNLNTASYHLLAHVSGIGEGLAKTIVEFRVKHGSITNRVKLLEIPRFTKKVFEQAAGFLRIPESDNPLDNTSVHPERYAMLENFAKGQQKAVKDLVGAGVEIIKKATELKKEIGEFTYQDIIRELAQPGRDPREEFTPFQFRDDIHEVGDLQPGMICPGLVTNVTAFGAFVDIGVHQDGLVHISELSDTFVKDPKDVVSPGDKVSARVLKIDRERNQISLSMKSEGSERRPSPEAGRSAYGQSSSHQRRPEQQRTPQAANLAPSSLADSPFAKLAQMIQNKK